MRQLPPTGIGKERYGSIPEFQKIPDLHTNVYRISAEIGACLSRSAHAEANALLAEQNTCSRELLKSIAALRSAISMHTKLPTELQNS